MSTSKYTTNEEVTESVFVKSCVLHHISLSLSHKAPYCFLARIIGRETEKPQGNVCRSLLSSCLPIGNVLQFI